jgi:hypothetical protein
MTTAPPPRLPVVGMDLFIRIHLDIWIVTKVTAVGADGCFDALDVEGEPWSVPLSLRGRAWRFLDDPSDPLAERRSLINICMLGGLREERERILAIVRAYSVPGAGWIDSPEAVIEAIESGVTVGTAGPSSETGGERAS